MNSTLGSRGLLSSRPNVKQEPFQTALSGSHLYCLSSCPRGAAIYGAERGAQPAGWSRLFTDLACLSGMRGRKKKRQTGRAGWDSMSYRRSLWRHQCLHFTSAQDSPTAHPVPGGKSLLWGLTEPDKCLIRWRSALQCGWRDKICIHTNKQTM